MNDILNEINEMQKNATCLFSKNEIEQAIHRVAQEMNEKLKDKNPLFLAVMNGAVVFMGQLVTQLNFPLQIDYIHVSRYRGEMQGRDLHWLATPRIPMKNRTICIVEDILDSGLTLAAVIDFCIQEGATKVYTATLVDKEHPRDKDGLIKADFTGLNVPDKFLIGYGLDYQEYFRNLDGIYAVNS